MVGLLDINRMRDIYCNTTRFVEIHENTIINTDITELVL